MSLAQSLLAEFEIQAAVTRKFLERLPDQEVLDAFEESITAVRSVLPTFDDAAMSETWRLVVDGQEILAQPRGEFLRDIMLGHWYQHRGQFSVYLRLLNIPVPAS